MEEREFYHGPVYRPPSEASSLIVQTTFGCSHNKCAYCSMYNDWPFRIKPLGDVFDDFDYARKLIPHVPSVFLADGDAFVRKSSDQLAILDHIRRVMPECERVSAYAYPRNVLTKTPQEMKKIREAGLKKLYFGFESGDDEVLRRVNKGVTADEVYRACMMIKEAGIELSAIMIVGLGGKALSWQHAIHSAELMNRIKPDVVAANMLMRNEPCPRRDAMLRGECDMETPLEMLAESRVLIDALDCEGSRFYAMHVSNYVPLGGMLNRDKARFLSQIDAALAGETRLTPDWMRRF